MLLSNFKTACHSDNEGERHFKERMPGHVVQL